MKNRLRCVQIDPQMNTILFQRLHNYQCFTIKDWQTKRIKFLVNPTRKGVEVWFSPYLSKDYRAYLVDIYYPSKMDLFLDWFSKYALTMYLIIMLLYFLIIKGG